KDREQARAMRAEMLNALQLLQRRETDDEEAEGTLPPSIVESGTCPIPCLKDQALWSAFCNRFPAPLNRWIEPRSVGWAMATRSCYIPFVEEDGLTHPFHLAAASGDAKSCCEFVKMESNLMAVDAEGNTLLIMAAAAPGDKCNRLVRTLLGCFQDPDERAKYVKMTNHDGLTALHFAVLASRPSLVQLLLDAGADPNAGIYRTRDGEWFGLTPLHFSLSITTKKSARCRQILLEAGADPNVEMACCSDPLETASVVSECGCGTCFSADLCAFTGQFPNLPPGVGADLTRLYTSCTLSVFADGPSTFWGVGKTVVPDGVVFDASRSCRQSRCRGRHAPPKQTGERGCARLQGLDRAVLAGANVNHCPWTDASGQESGSPLHLLLNECPYRAVERVGSTEDLLWDTAEALLDCPALDLNQRDSMGMTALMVACRFNHTTDVV
ncbi:hypothetical protein BaRGS_00003522, partial [Batillaria attramentaria]